jgi:hypothetical protein
MLNLIQDIEEAQKMVATGFAALKDALTRHASTVAGEVGLVATDVGNAATGIVAADPAITDVASLGGAAGDVVAGVVEAGAQGVAAGAAVVQDLANDAATATLPTTPAGWLAYGFETIEKAITDLTGGQGSADVHVAMAALDDLKAKTAVLAAAA